MTPDAVAPLRGVGISVPVHDEEKLLPAALDAIGRATQLPALLGRTVVIAVVLDCCSDRSRAIADAFAVDVAAQGPWRRVVVCRTDVGNVGVARHTGISAVLDAWGGRDPFGLWLATTDADSRVPACWIGHQLHHRRHGVEAWAGTVHVDDWSERGFELAAVYRARYRLDLRQRAHVHGANLGFTAHAYELAGGFPPVATGEDHALWSALATVGARRCQDTSCPVTTSSRCVARAPLGFASHLDGLERHDGLAG
jgi:glycosyltransferase involved in cell wall biosynthesis